MVRFNIDDVTEDMVLGESIVLPSGELLLGAGYNLKSGYLKRLREFGFTSIMVQVEGTEDVVPETTVSEQAQREMSQNFSSSAEQAVATFESLRKKGVTSVKEIIKDKKKHLGKFIMNAGIANALEKFIEEIMTQNSVVLNLSKLSEKQASLFTHTMNVTVTALCIGRKYRFSYEEMRQLAIGALNYDIGLVTVPQEILKKSSPLEKEEKMMLQQHTINGYLMLSEIPTIPSTSAAAALQHHEHQNGSGYPRGLEGENRPPVKDFSRKSKIHRYAEIIAVADKFDMMTTGRKHYSKPMQTKDAIKRLIQMGGTILNSEIVKEIVKIIPVFPVGARIKITDAPTNQLIGYRGVIARDNVNDLEKPQIIIYETKKGNRTPKPVLIDLSKHSGFKLELIT